MSDPFAPCAGVPLRLVAGDFWTWREDGLGLAPGLHALAYAFAREDGAPGGLDIAATEDAAGFLVAVPNAETALAGGRYRWTAVLTRIVDGASVTVRAGVAEVAAEEAGDRRSVNRRILDAITARLEGRITKDAESYSIEGRTISRTPLDVLETLRTTYARRVAAEEGRGGVRWARATMR